MDKYDELAQAFVIKLAMSKELSGPQIAAFGRACAAEAYEDAARMSREDEIRVVLLPGSAHETKYAWGVKCLAAFASMLTAKAAALRTKGA